MPAWPSDLADAESLSLVRTGLPLTRDDPRDCPTALALKARPWVVARHKSPHGEPFQTFTLKALMTGLDLVEHSRRPVPDVLEELHRTRGTFGRGRTPAHPGLVEWTAQALPRYLAARACEEAAREAAGEPRVYPVAEEWVLRSELRVADARGAEHYERTAWGRRYVSLDGSLRELRLLSFGGPKTERPESELAAAAFVAAAGEPCRSDYDRKRKRPGRYTAIPAQDLPSARTATPQRVRIVATGCTTGTHEELRSRTPREAEHDYRRFTVPVLRNVVDATDRTPGGNCRECPAAASCSELPQRPGLLALPQPARRPRPRRNVSASDLRAYRECPAKYHLTRELNLPSPRVESAAIRRGRAVDAELNKRHTGPRTRNGCRDLPTPDDAAWAGLSEEDAAAAARMTSEHAAVCPLNGLPLQAEVRVQHQVVAYDPELDLIVIATPDLLYTRDGSWIWRETKTASSYLYEGKSLLGNYRQLALAVVLMNAGVPPGDPRRSRIELELIYHDDCGLEEIDPWQPSVLDEARTIVGETATAWISDTTYAPRPGDWCTGCEALEWCAAGRTQIAGTTLS